MKKLKKILVICTATSLILGSAINASAANLRDIFDAKYYAEKYEDLKAAFGDNEELLYQHYITYGIKEGRVASALFNVQKYRDLYADLEAAYGDDWNSYAEHYLNFGLNEGRDGGGEFDAVSYADRYADLYAAYGYDIEALYAHYQTYGMEEGRNASSQAVINESNVATVQQNTSVSVPSVPVPEAPVVTAAPTPTEAPVATEAPTPTEAPVATETPIPTEAPVATEAPTPTATPAPTQAYIEEVVALVNEERANEGLAALEIDTTVQAAAMERAQELVTLYSHTRPDGTGCFTVLDEYGVEYMACGENIAVGYASPEAVMEGWMNSEGHRANILTEGYTHIGVGYYYDPNGTYKYNWVQLFIKK